MRKRSNKANEPRTNKAAVYVHLGMTKGAFVSVIVLTCAVIVGFVRLEQITGRLNEQVRSNRALIRKVERLSKQGVEAHNANCALRDDLRRRVNASVAFLESHPNGAFGISAATIVKSIADTRKTIVALDAAHCD